MIASICTVLLRSAILTKASSSCSFFKKPLKKKKKRLQNFHTCDLLICNIRLRRSNLTVRNDRQGVSLSKWILFNTKRICIPACALTSFFLCSYMLVASLMPYRRSGYFPYIPTYKIPCYQLLLPPTKTVVVSTEVIICSLFVREVGHTAGGRNAHTEP